MRGTTTTHVDAAWRAVFDLSEDELWRHVTVRPHTGLGDYPGWYVAWRAAGVHVSAPPSATAAQLGSLGELTGPELSEKDLWASFARTHGLTLLGPSVHHVLDVDPGRGLSDVSDLSDVSETELDGLRRRVSPAAWQESGLSHAELFFGIRVEAEVVAAAGLDTWDGAPRDVGVLVDPRWRGRGLGTRVGGAAASYAVTEHGRARWRALRTNVASTRAAARLGFEPWATQLAVRP